MNMKKHNTSGLLSGVTKLEKIFTQKEKLKNSLNSLTILTNIARKEHRKIIKIIIKEQNKS